MKRLISMLAATLVAGLIVYSLLELTGYVGVSMQGRVSMPIWLFVIQMFAMGMLASPLSAWILQLIRKTESPPEEP